MKWYAVQVYSGYEKRVKLHLEEDISMSDFKDFFGRILVPTETQVEMKNGKRVKSERKFFPGYVIVEMEVNEDTWRFVSDIPRVLGFIGSKDKPYPMTKPEVERILAFVEGDSTQCLQLRDSFQVGQVIRINDGPFKDFVGTVEGVNQEKRRLQISVTIFGRTTPVELEFSQVEKES